MRAVGVIACLRAHAFEHERDVIHAHHSGTVVIFGIARREGNKTVSLPGAGEALFRA